MEKIKKVFIALVCIFLALFVSVIILLAVGSSESFNYTLNELEGSITGNTYTIDKFDNFGNKTMVTHGQKINVEPVIIEEEEYSNGSWGYVKTLSSVLEIYIDGHEMDSCGDTLIFYESGLVPDVEYKEEDIESTSDGWEDNAIVAGVINKYKNFYGKSRVVVIESQTGYPIYAFSGESVYVEVPDNLPKFTKITIDGKQLYIHRANYQIIDSELIDE